MFKTGLVIIGILLVGAFVVALLFKFWQWAERLDDEDYQEMLEAERSLREARDDLRYEQAQAQRMRDLDDGGQEETTTTTTTTRKGKTK